MYNLFTIAMVRLQIFLNIRRKQVPDVKGCISYKRHVTLKITDNAIKQDILETFMYWHFSAFDFKGEMCLYLGLLMQFTKVYSFFAKKLNLNFLWKKSVIEFVMIQLPFSLYSFISHGNANLNVKHLYQ